MRKVDIQRRKFNLEGVYVNVTVFNASLSNDPVISVFSIKKGYFSPTISLAAQESILFVL